MTGRTNTFNNDSYTYDREDFYYDIRFRGHNSDFVLTPRWTVLYLPLMRRIFNCKVG